MNKSFMCGECGHDVTFIQGKNRTLEFYKGVHLDIPDDYLLPTCSHCGETYSTAETRESHDPMLIERFTTVCRKFLADLEKNPEDYR